MSSRPQSQSDSFRPGDIVLEVGISLPWVVMLVEGDKVLLFNEATDQLEWSSSRYYYMKTNARVEPALFKHAVYSDGTKVTLCDTIAYNDHDPIFDIVQIVGLNRIAIRDLNSPTTIFVEDSARMRLCF